MTTQAAPLRHQVEVGNSGRSGQHRRREALRTVETSPMKKEWFRTGSCLHPPKIWNVDDPEQSRWSPTRERRALAIDKTWKELHQRRQETPKKPGEELTVKRLRASAVSFIFRRAKGEGTEKGGGGITQRLVQTCVE